MSDLDRQLRPVSLVVRTALTVYLLVLVYQGSRLALVTILALMALAIELHALLRRWDLDA